MRSVTSRYRECLSETAKAAITAITKAVTEYGAPALVLSDNGAAFAGPRSQLTAVSSTFSRTVNGWGTRLIHSSPYHPQTCGKVERHHQTSRSGSAPGPHPPA